MPPPASIVVPTRGRPGYLAVTLASVAPQVQAAGAELLVVEDGPATGEVTALAARHGARHLAHGRARGLNAARNTGVAATTGELVAFLDDDVLVADGWLAALLDAAGRHPGHGLLGGPIHARLEGPPLRFCGREPAPVTTLDLGPADREAEFLWGANFAVRRGALARVGPFDERLEIYGDEEDWQRRHRDTGGRARYVAGAGVQHRRAGDDARLRGLARAAYGRGRSLRRYDAHKGTAPGPGRELRVLAGCLWHTGRRRCANGVIMAAHSAGRLREALAGP